MENPNRIEPGCVVLNTLGTTVAFGDLTLTVDPTIMSVTPQALQQTALEPFEPQRHTIVKIQKPATSKNHRGFALKVAASCRREWWVVSGRQVITDKAGIDSDNGISANDVTPFGPAEPENGEDEDIPEGSVLEPFPEVAGKAANFRTVIVPSNQRTSSLTRATDIFVYRLRRMSGKEPMSGLNAETLGDQPFAIIGRAIIRVEIEWSGVEGVGEGPSDNTDAAEDPPEQEDSLPSPVKKTLSPRKRLLGFARRAIGRNDGGAGAA